jgi:hypothetical protein
MRLSNFRPRKFEDVTQPFFGEVMGRFKPALSLLGVSLGTVLGRPRLLAFPFITAAGWAGCAGLVYLQMVLSRRFPAFDSWVVWLSVCLVAYYLLNFFGVFIRAALLVCLEAAFRGQRLELGRGFAAAAGRSRQLAWWSCIDAFYWVVFLPLAALGELLGSLAEFALDVSWGVGKYMTLPLIVFENLGPVAALKQSAATLKARFGPQIAGGCGLGLLQAAILAAVACGWWLANGQEGPALLPGLALMALGAVGGAFVRALSEVFDWALYRYVKDGKAPGGFTSEGLDAVVIIGS